MSDQIEQVMDKAARRICRELGDASLKYRNQSAEQMIAEELEPITRLLRAGQGCRDWLHVHGSPIAAIEAWDAALRAALEER